MKRLTDVEAQMRDENRLAGSRSLLQKLVADRERVVREYNELYFNDPDDTRLHGLAEEGLALRAEIERLQYTRETLDARRGRPL